MRMKYNFQKKKQKKNPNAEIVSSERYMEFGLCIKLTFCACVLLLAILLPFSVLLVSFIHFLCLWLLLDDISTAQHFFHTLSFSHECQLFTCYTNGNDLAIFFHSWFSQIINGSLRFFYSFALIRLSECLISEIVIGMCCVLCYVMCVSISIEHWVRAFSIYACKIFRYNCT